MLIYNYKKEFIGIDEKYLKTMGLENLAQLHAEAADFADLFVKTPGYVHNFKHVHWIDYITCADSAEQPKVIINANNNLFKADVHITTAYLADNPLEKAYLVNLNHLRALTDAEKGNISKALVDRPAPTTTPKTAPAEFNVAPQAPVTPPKTPVVEKVVEDEYDIGIHNEPLDVGDLSVDDVVDDSFALMHEEDTKTVEETPLDIDFALDLPESIELEEPVEVAKEPKPQPKPEPKPQPQPSTTKAPASETALDPELLKILNSGYVYNPQIASDELGLPLDLIEEFIEDFINQAKEFKDGLYTALDEGDVDNVKILSHKLKGVAANLRIEDALEVLTTINTTGDLNVIKNNLDIFYILIAKLSGEEIDLNNPTAVLEPAQEEELILDFKEDVVPQTIELEETTQEEPIQIAETVDEPLEIMIADSDVPEQIEIPELADDNFVAQDEISIDLDEEPFALQDTDTEELTFAEDISIAPETAIHYSVKNIAHDIGLDPESLHELIDDFQVESREIANSIKTALENNDLDRAKSQARQLKGMSDNLRLSEIGSSVLHITDAADTQTALAELEKLEKVLENISIED